MKKLFLLCTMGLFFIMPLSCFAEECVEIVLEEIPIYHPLDDPDMSTPPPSNPTQFSAILQRRILTVTSQSTSTTRVIITNLSTWDTILDKQFIGTTSEQLMSSGFYRIEMYSEENAVEGYFEAE